MPAGAHQPFIDPPGAGEQLAGGWVGRPKRGRAGAESLPGLRDVLPVGLPILELRRFLQLTKRVPRPLIRTGHLRTVTRVIPFSQVFTGESNEGGAAVNSA